MATSAQGTASRPDDDRARLALDAEAADERDSVTLEASLEESDDLPPTAVKRARWHQA